MRKTGIEKRQKAFQEMSRAEMWGQRGEQKTNDQRTVSNAVWVMLRCWGRGKAQRAQSCQSVKGLEYNARGHSVLREASG